MLNPQSKPVSRAGNPRGLTLIAIAAAGALAVGAALPALADSQKTETRTPGNFTKIESSGAFVLEVTAGQSPAVVVVTADADVLPEVKTVVAGEVMRISMEKTHFSMNGRIVVKIGVPKLTAISASGANKIDVSNLAGEHFEIDGSGSTKATLGGKVDKLEIRVSGAGRVDAAGLAAKTAEISTSGAGHVDVNASDKLDVSISGAGKVNYLGNPVISKHVSGAGKIAAMK